MTAPTLAPERAVRPARARTSTAAVALAAAAVGVVALSVLVGARTLSPAVLLDPADPLFAVYQVRFERTLLGLCVGAALLSKDIPRLLSFASELLLMCELSAL